MGSAMLEAVFFYSFAVLCMMMTGQILSGTLPTTAIMYQIAVIIANCTSVCLTTFFSLSLGYRTMYNGRNQYIGYRKEQ